MRGRDGATWHRCQCGWAGYRRFSDKPCPRKCGRTPEVWGGLPGPPLLPRNRVRQHINVYVPREVLDAIKSEQRTRKVRTLSRTVAAILEAWHLAKTREEKAGIAC